jgi:nitrilase
VGGRETFGNSMVVDPWGSVLAQLPRGPGVISADVDLERVTSIRKSFPATEHRRIRCV